MAVGNWRASYGMRSLLYPQGSRYPGNTTALCRVMVLGCGQKVREAQKCTPRSDRNLQAKQKETPEAALSSRCPRSWGETEGFVAEYRDAAGNVNRNRISSPLLSHTGFKATLLQYAPHPPFIMALLSPEPIAYWQPFTDNPLPPPWQAIMQTSFATEDQSSVTRDHLQPKHQTVKGIARPFWVVLTHTPPILGWCQGPPADRF